MLEALETGHNQMISSLNPPKLIELKQSQVPSRSVNEDGKTGIILKFWSLMLHWKTQEIFSQKIDIGLLLIGEYELINQLDPQLQNKLKDIILSDRRRSPENQILPHRFHKVNYISNKLRNWIFVSNKYCNLWERPLLIISLWLGIIFS